MEREISIQERIYEVRGMRVMLDRDLAEENLRFQFGISRWGGSRTLPFAFTEQGVAMLSSVLRSQTAIQTSIRIIDAFVAMRNYIMSTRSIEAELSALRARLQLLERADEETLEAVNDLSEDVRAEISTIYQAIAALSVKVNPTQPPQQRKIGFKTGNDDEK